MVYPQSSEEQPLHFFIEVFLKGAYDDVKKSFFHEWKQTKEEIDNNIFISIKQDFIIHYFNSNERNEPFPTKFTFLQALEELVEIQCEKSKKLINQGVGSLLLKSKSITPYLVEQTQVLKTLSEKNHPQLPKHIIIGLNAFA